MKLTPVVMAAFIVLLVFAINTASATDTIEINAIGINYEYDGWSNEQYPLIDLFGEEYVPLFISNGNAWNCKVDKLARLVIDSDANYTLKAGDVIDFGNGYTLEAKQFDIEGNKVWLEFSKDGQYIDDQIISVSGAPAEKTWTVTLDNIQNENDIVVMKVHVNQIIPGASGSIAQIDGIWLIDYTNVRRLKLDDKIGAFELTEISGEKLVFEYISGQPSPNEIRITTCESLKGYPSIYGDKVIWADWRNGLGIYTYDLSTSNETEVTTNESWNDAPAIYEDRIVWQSSSIGNWDNADLYMLNLSASEKTRITNDSSNQQDPAIYGDKIVWTDWRNDNGSWGNGDIYMYDLSTSTETQITNDGSCQDSPAIYGDKIVWTDWRNDNGSWSNGDIYMYDLSTSKEIQVTNNESKQYSPAIYGDRIVWSDRRNGDENSDIYIYDLSTSTETQITNNESNQYSPTIYEDRIVWTDERNGELDELGHIVNSDIYMYDLSTSTEARITTNMADQMEPAIYMDRIVWMDKRNGNMGYYSEPEVYVFTISGGESEPDMPVADFTTNVTEGYASLSVQFTDLSENATGRNWDFESDGIVDSTDKNQVHMYTVPGEYTVKLIAFNVNGMDSKLVTITVLEQPVIPTASFRSSVTSGTAPLSISFTDLSTGIPAEWKWDFGDGITSTDQNPMHTYSAAGNYTVSLTVTNDAGRNTATTSDYIKVTAAVQKPTAAFSASTTSGPAPLEVKFTDMSIGAPTAWKWSFGDGTYSTAKNPKHRYTKTGEYTVSLTVKNVVGSNRVKKISYINAVSSINPVTANLTSIFSEKEPLKMQFIGNFAELHRARN